MDKSTLGGEGMRLRGVAGQGRGDTGTKVAVGHRTQRHVDGLVERPRELHRSAAHPGEAGFVDRTNPRRVMEECEVPAVSGDPLRYPRALQQHEVAPRRLGKTGGSTANSNIVTVSWLITAASQTRHHQGRLGPPAPTAWYEHGVRRASRRAMCRARRKDLQHGIHIACGQRFCCCGDHDPHRSGDERVEQLFLASFTS